MKVRFTRAAKCELREAAQWYEASKPGLGLQFKSAISRALARLKQYPESGALQPDDFRRAVVADFPYILWYEVSENEILIHAVSHTKRKPSYWKN